MQSPSGRPLVLQLLPFIFLSTSSTIRILLRLYPAGRRRPARVLLSSFLLAGHLLSYWGKVEEKKLLTWESVLKTESPLECHPLLLSRGRSI